ncbi:MAG: PaaI family thioesterase [Gammaproteobacteria bacterium]|nr:PaaI family thioesterase [Gammaproteobacteria bacterium]
MPDSRPHAHLQPLVDIVTALPHYRELGLEVVDYAPGSATLRCAHRPELVGDPVTGVVHGGVITSILDSVCGLACFLGLDEPQAIATLDLRIDYLRPARSGKAILGRGEVFRMTRSVAFLRGLAYQDRPEDAVATCVATFMVGSVGYNPAGDGGVQP